MSREIRSPVRKNHSHFRFASTSKVQTGGAFVPSTPFSFCFFYCFFCALFTVVILNRVVTITGCDHRLEITVLKSAFNRDPIKCNYHRGMATSNATGYKYRCCLIHRPSFEAIMKSKIVSLSAPYTTKKSAIQTFGK